MAAIFRVNKDALSKKLTLQIKLRGAHDRKRLRRQTRGHNGSQRFSWVQILLEGWRLSVVLYAIR